LLAKSASHFKTADTYTTLFKIHKSLINLNRKEIMQKNRS